MKLRLALLALLLAGQAFAESLIGTVSTGDLRLRKNAPIPLEVELTHRGQGLLEGHLECVLLHGERKVGVHRSSELALSTGTRSVSLLLPPPPGAEDADGVAIQLRFVGKQAPIALGQHRLGSYHLGGHDFVLASVIGGGRTNEVDAARVQSLRLESLRPLLEARAWFTTHTMSVHVEQLSTQPIGWCAFDVAVLDSAAFAAATARQLEALTRWVDAGGSAILFAGGALEDRHLECLRQLARDSAQAIVTDERGKLPRGEVLRLEAGLGRALVVPTPPTIQRDLRGNPWRAHVGWAWKLRPAMLEEIARTGTWPAKREDDDPYGTAHLYWSREFQDWLRVRAMGFDDLSPDRPRPLPLMLVVALLGSLLLLAGPGDWLVLGWLRRRRWTWVLFPVFCVASAWFAAQLAGRYLGRAGREGLVRITDIGPGNRVLRETTLTLKMTATDSEWATELRDGMVLPSVAARNDQFGAPTPKETIAEMHTAWLTPSKFALRQRLRQWTPAWREALAFPTEPDAGAPDWDGILQAWRKVGIHRTPEAFPKQPGCHYLFTRADQTFLLNGVADYRRVPDEMTRRLFQPVGPLGFLFAQYSPVIAGDALTATALAGHCGILAWREEPHALHIYRRHISAAEFQQAP